MSCHACFLQPPPPQHSIPSLLCHHCPNRSLIRRCDVCYHASDQAGWMLYRPLGPGRGAGCPGWGCVVMARCRGGLGPTRGSGVLVHTGLHLFVCNIIITYQVTCPCPSIITSSKTGNHCFFFTIRPQLSLVGLWYFVILITAFLPNPLAPCKFDGDKAKARRMSACPMSLSLPRVQW